MVLFNGTEQVAVEANGGFTFPAPLDVGASFDVNIDHAPGSPAQRCVVANGSGTIAAANVTNVSVTCEAAKHSTFMLTANYQDNTLSVLATDRGNLRTRPTVSTGDGPADVASGSTTRARLPHQQEGSRMHWEGVRWRS